MSCDVNLIISINLHDFLVSLRKRNWNFYWERNLQNIKFLLPRSYVGWMKNSGANSFNVLLPHSTPTGKKIYAKRSSTVRWLCCNFWMTVDSSAYTLWGDFLLHISIVNVNRTFIKQTRLENRPKKHAQSSIMQTQIGNCGSLLLGSVEPSRQNGDCYDRWINCEGRFS